MQLSDWRPAFSPRHPERPDELPLDSDAGVFQLRKWIQAVIPIDHLVSVDQSAFLGMGQSLDFKTIKADFKYQLVTPSGQVIFEQTVEISMTCTTMSFTVFGGLSVGMFTWYVPANGVKIKTTIINGQTITPENPAWSYTWPKSLATPFTEQGYVIPDSLGDFGIDYGLAEGWYMGPVYEMRIPVGTKLKIIFDRWQSRITRNPSWQFRFDEGGTFATTTDVPGALRLATPQGNKIPVTHTYSGPSEMVERASIYRATNPSLFKDNTNKLYIGAIVDSAYRLFWSQDDGSTFHPYTILDSDQKEVPMTIWDSTYNNPVATMTTSGAIVSLAQKGGHLYFKSSADQFSAARYVTPVKKSEPFNLVETSPSGSPVLVATNGRDIILQSADGGVSWSLIQ